MGSTAGTAAMAKGAPARKDMVTVGKVMVATITGKEGNSHRISQAQK